jgi:cell division protein FtsB
MTSAPAPAETNKVRNNHLLLVGVTLALGVLLGFLVFFSHRGLYQIYRFRTERTHLEQDNARLAAENDRLARTIDRLQHDPEFIQDLIRRELNFIKKHEVIFQLPPALGTKPEAPPAAVKAEPATREILEPEGPKGGERQGDHWSHLEGAPKKP